MIQTPAKMEERVKMELRNSHVTVLRAMRDSCVKPVSVDSNEKFV